MPRPIRRPRPPQERAARAREWARWFSGPSSGTDYRRALVTETGLPEPLAWELVGDLVELLVERVPASLGVPAALAIAAFLRDEPKATEASRALLTAILEELRPAHTRTMLESLALAWQEVRRFPHGPDRQRRIGECLARTIRRLAASDAAGIETIEALLSVMDDQAMPIDILEGT